ncbi:alpha/beta hydrolase [Neorhodopirellula pilleata]|nr:alpha/beta hydrolase [Neorhodopirellula pilleata]
MISSPRIAVRILIALVAVGSTLSQAQDPQTQRKMGGAGAVVETYKATEDATGNPVQLNAYVFYPADHQPNDRRAAIVFFFGGGWKSGTPSQFLEHCRYLSSRGMVAITADYRVLGRQGTKALKCVADGKSAVRWVRKNADRLGVDVNRVAAGGGSAGGHVAACTGVIEGFEEPGEDLTVSSRPDAMALFNPAVVLAAINGRPPLDPEKVDGLEDRMGTSPKKLSPVHHVGKNAPPTILFHGRADDTVPYWTAEAFRDAMVGSGNRCELIGFDGQGHGFFNHGRGNNENYEKTIRELDRFLVSIGFLSPQSPDETSPIPN